MAPNRNQFGGHAASLLSRLDNAGPPRTSQLPGIPQAVKRAPVPKMEQAMISPIKIRFPHGNEDPPALWKGNGTEEVLPVFRSPRRPVRKLEPISVEASNIMPKSVALPLGQILAHAEPSSKPLPETSASSSWSQGPVREQQFPPQLDEEALECITPKFEKNTTGLDDRGKDYAERQVSRLRSELDKIQSPREPPSVDASVRESSRQYYPITPAAGGPGFVRHSANFASNLSSGGAPPPRDAQKGHSNPTWGAAGSTMEVLQPAVQQVSAGKSEIEREQAAALEELVAASPFDYNALKAAVERAQAAGVQGEELTNAQAAIRRAEAHRSLNNTLNHSIEVACEIASVGSANGAEQLDAELEVLRGALEDARASGLEGSDVAAAEDFLYHEGKRADAAAELREAAASGDGETIRQALSKAREVGVDGQELSRAEVFLWKESLIKDAHTAIEDALLKEDLLGLRAAMAQARVAGMTDEERILVVQEFITRGHTFVILQMKSAFDAWRDSLLAPMSKTSAGGDDFASEKHGLSGKEAMLGFKAQSNGHVEKHECSESQQNHAMELLREDLELAVSRRDAKGIRCAVLQAINSGLDKALVNRIVLDVQKSKTQSKEATPEPVQDNMGVKSDVLGEHADKNTPMISQDEAATKVQAAYRGRTARLNAKEQRQVRQVQLAKDQEQAAIRVQSMYRGRAAREEAARARATQIPSNNDGQLAADCRAIDVGSMATHAVDVGIITKDLAVEQTLPKEDVAVVERALPKEESHGSAEAPTWDDPYQELSLALQSGDSARVRCAVQAAEVAGANAKEVTVLAAALRGDGSVDPVQIAHAAMSLAGCGVPGRPRPQNAPPAQAPSAPAHAKKGVQDVRSKPSVASEAPRCRPSTPDRLEAQKKLADAKASKDVAKLRNSIDHAKQLGVDEHHVLAAQAWSDREERKKKVEKELAMAMWGGDMDYLAKVLEDAREARVPRSAVAVAESILEKERGVRVAQDELTAAVSSKDPFKIQGSLAAARAAGVPRIRLAAAERALQATSAVQMTEEGLAVATKSRDPKQLRNAIKAAEKAGVDEAKLGAATSALRDAFSEAADRLRSVVAKVAEGSYAGGSSDFVLLKTALELAMEELGDASADDEDAAPLSAAVEAAHEVLFGEKGLVYQAHENLAQAVAKADLQALRAAIPAAHEANVEPAAIVAAQNALLKLSVERMAADEERTERTADTESKAAEPVFQTEQAEVA